ncbi:valine--tRNA ligase [Candidatus Falkowbacteria bacterium CG10_big_fil_rev_8_21_14_0_10_44_15]|uniref:Valine--tRNA ligase n=1 Tax=Candidatus Falkowbacteria bacterium CG10_big_fil_rev_8_21_14_0_10_44_15 TaxID=1974569 RepID=A0A2H0UZ60_9BACT|nr:MAG: valine--tRNA ligase [Candidatus Falkowbacteria bacterium CG10_big_fil_rev_8_21_14_0_10_44_15]
MTDKIMNKELPKAYNPSDYEDGIYQKWERSGFFNPDVCVAKKICKQNADTFTVVLPPPNITDKLHLGHMVMVAITDILVRYHRMSGKRALWIPGTDHAAIATQNVVEKKLWQEEKKTRHDLGRKKFLAEVWKFVKETQAAIIHQLKKTGASLDWSREAFTLDAARQAAVKRMFIEMYNEGVIYRGDRIVNWCPRCQSTLADDEVEYKEQDGKFYTFKYNKNFPFAIATTRPETKLGDTAVAVNPDDERYKKYIGKIYEVDFCGVPLTLKVIADKNVDQNFGTGALGVTPAHSMVDYEMAQKNKLEIKKIINEEGKMADAGKFSGLAVMEAREQVVQKLIDSGLMEKEENIKNNLSVCYRCGAGIEPLPSKQWFVAVDKKLAKLGNKSLKQKAIEVVKSGKIKFVPERFTKRYLDWMANLHDWCISRQIWFGHQIPAYYQVKSKKLKVKSNEEIIYVGDEKPAGEGWTQDSDVLDTWFSSGMWTFSTLGWPASATLRRGKPIKTADLKTYYPTQVLETGYEIITLWVSRMIMMSLFAVAQIPFENVYLHGMVLDAQGKKMSKSKGNGIDPLAMIQKYGTDATRMSLIVGNTPGNDTRMSEQKIAAFRNFANKLWNIARYIITNYELRITNLKTNKVGLTLADKWILGKMNSLIKDVTDDIEHFRFSQGGERLRDFTWNDLADWYLEVSKFEATSEKNKILNLVLEALLKLWHPFMPFVTETLWQEIGHKELLMVERWPKREMTHKLEAAAQFNLIIDIIKTIRNLRSEYKIPPEQKVKAIIYAGKQVELLQSQAELIKNLRTGVGELEIKPSGAKLKQAAWAAVGEKEIYIPLAGLIDVAKERARLEKRAQELNQLIKNLEVKLDNEEFVKRAPKEIVEAEIRKLENYRAEHKKLKEQTRHLK